MMAAKDSVTYQGAISGSQKNDSKLSLKAQLDFIERSNTWIQTVLPLGKDALRCKVVLKRKMDEKELIICYKVRPVAKEICPEERTLQLGGGPHQY